MFPVSMEHFRFPLKMQEKRKRANIIRRTICRRAVTTSIRCIRSCSPEYKISRPFNIAYKGDLSGLAKDFVDYILSSDGQAVISKEGYVPVSDNAAYAGTKPEGKITVAGSSSVSPVMEKLIEAYKQVNTKADIELQTSDSSAGMQSALEGTCDIGMASRELKDTETALASTTIAKDGIAVIVNTNNTTENLTMDQVKAIYTGEAKVWSDITK